MDWPAARRKSRSTRTLQAPPGHSLTNTSTQQAPEVLATHSKRARSFQVRTQLFHAAAPELSIARVKHLAAFKHNFDLFVARVRGPDGAPGCLDELFDEFLRDNLQFADGFPAPSGVFRSADKEGQA